jgi:hypothetical protein
MKIKNDARTDLNEYFLIWFYGKFSVLVTTKLTGIVLICN